MLRCVILDDEPLAREVLEDYLNRLDYVRSTNSFGTAEETLTFLRKHEAEVLFLDIEMPGMNGLDFLRSLDNPPVTVFTTAYRNYAFEGYELGVIDFLLKPIAYSRFLQALVKVQDFYTLRGQATIDDTQEEPAFPKSIEDGSVAERGPAATTFIFVKSGVQRIKLYFEDVRYIQGLKDYAIIHTTNGKVVLKGSVKAMLDLFPSPRFLRVHKSFIVAQARISRIEHNRLFLDEIPVPLGRSYREEVSRVLFGS